MESRVFSTDTLMAGMATLQKQNIKVESVEDKAAMERELQDTNWNPNLDLPSTLSKSLFAHILFLSKSKYIYSYIATMGCHN